MSAPITGLYASLLGILLIVLSGLVIRQRIINRVLIGDGKVPTLERAMRVQANFVEYVPIALLLLLVTELHQGTPRMLHAYGIALLVGRLLHAVGLTITDKPNVGRFLGTNITALAILGLAVVNLRYYWLQ